MTKPCVSSNLASQLKQVVIVKGVAEVILVSLLFPPPVGTDPHFSFSYRIFYCLIREFFGSRVLSTYLPSALSELCQQQIISFFKYSNDYKLQISTNPASHQSRLAFSCLPWLQRGHVTPFVTQKEIKVLILIRSL